MVRNLPEHNFAQWLIFFTQWGVILNTLSSGFALLVSVMVILKGTRGKNVIINLGFGL